MDLNLFSVENLPTLLFCLGILVEVFLIAKKDVFTKMFWGVFAFFIIIFLFPFDKEPLSEYKLITHLFTGVIFFAIGAGFIFMNRILFKLTEFKFLFFEIIFLYIMYSVFGLGLIFYLSVLPLLVGLIFCIFPFVPGFKTKLLFYVWFLITWLACGLFITSKFVIQFILGPISPSFNPIEYFFFGISSYFSIMIFFFLMALIPLPGKHESLSEAIKRAKEMAVTMVAKFDDTHAGIHAAVLVLVGVGGIIILNLTFGFISAVSIVSVFLALSSVFDIVYTKPDALEEETF